MKKLSLFFFLFAFLFLSYPVNLWAHGIVGQRFFPATIVVDDPFVADEMDLLAYSNLRTPSADPSGTSLVQTYGAGISKRLTRDLGFSIAVLNTQPDIVTLANGYQNLSTNLKYVFYKNGEHETIFATGLSVNIDGTGTKSVVQDTPTTLIPTLYFGKGFGDLSDSAKYLRPFAITGTVGLGTPLGNNSGDATSVNQPGTSYWSSLNIGLTLQYSTMYLQSFVKDIGIPKPFSRTIPVIEFTSSTLVNGPEMGTTIAYAYPGLIWVGKYYELAVEAILPTNSTTGSLPGFQALVHLFLDDLSPQIFTRSVSGEVLGPTQPQ